MQRRERESQGRKQHWRGQQSREDSLQSEKEIWNMAWAKSAGIKRADACLWMVLFTFKSLIGAQAFEAWLCSLLEMKKQKGTCHKDLVVVSLRDHWLVG